MRVFAAWTVTAALVVGACGGNVVVDGVGSTRQPGVGGAGSSSVGVGAGQGVSGGGTAGAGTAGGGPGCVPTCLQAFMNGGVPCSGAAFADYNSLLLCAGCSDTGNCQGVCSSSTCAHFAPSPDCFNCIESGCMAEIFACKNN